MRKFAISDIHGCAHTFKALLGQLELDWEDELYLLGDYIDRGPNSKAVIDHILELQLAGHKVHCLRGNHEQLLLDSLERGGRVESLWMANGGLTTIESFGVDNTLDISERYIGFFQQLDHYYEVDRFILVHAGLNFDAEDPFADKNNLIWIRNWQGDIDREWLGDRVIVHGHTPISSKILKRQTNYIKDLPAINIDSGCVFKSPGLHQLCALDLDNLSFYFQKNID